MNFIQLQNWYKLKKAKIYTRLIRSSFGCIGKDSGICPPFHTNDPSEIYIGEYCWINPFCWLDCVRQYGPVKFSPRLEIGDRTYIGHRAHIIACGPMRIGKNVVIADGVYITDNGHGYKDVHQPILPQALTYPGPVTIEDEVWLGEGVCVMPNVTIGKHSVIGSNAVVTKSIPPYSVAVGAPAKVIKTYNPTSARWEKGEASSNMTEQIDNLSTGVKQDPVPVMAK